MIAGETPRASYAYDDSLRPLVVGSDEARRPSTPKVKLPGKSEVIFDGVDAPFQLGTNNERCLDPKNRIALQKFIALEEQMGDEGAIAPAR